jgi:hypothetical protein
VPWFLPCLPSPEFVLTLRDESRGVLLKVNDVANPG